MSVLKGCLCKVACYHCDGLHFAFYTGVVWHAQIVVSSLSKMSSKSKGMLMDAHNASMDCTDLHLVQVIWWEVFSKTYADEIAAETQVFGGDGSAKSKNDLRARVTEHNILVIAKYYSRLQLSRLAQLLDLPPEEVSCLVMHDSAPAFDLTLLLVVVRGDVARTHALVNVLCSIRKDMLELSG